MYFAPQTLKPGYGPDSAKIVSTIRIFCFEDDSDSRCSITSNTYIYKSPLGGPMWTFWGGRFGLVRRWVGIQVFDDQQEAPVNTALSQHKLFTRKRAIYFPEVDKTCEYTFARLPRFLENFLESGKLCCSAMGVTKTALGVLQLCFYYFALHYF